MYRIQERMFILTPITHIHLIGLVKNSINLDFLQYQLSSIVLIT